MSERIKLDKTDRRLLRELQRNGRISNQELAERTSLSTAPCWRRLKKLEDSGVINRYVALLDSHKLGMQTMAFIHLSLLDHSDASIAAIDEFVEQSPEVMECYAITGSEDYLLRIVAEDMEALERFMMQKLLKLKGVKSTNSSLVLRQKKYTTELPISD
ncbi:Lrp/AsnC family transcriptional regulator [Marinobacterium sedimentorum]|jgi:DNA-binding Lrp family transcriptional regulator|uniref:Lrp/AsnC family transcriptional regulator n=1 Tax=Marinobacterium sedimentorum TaxID=2927804 RepID=UPI0020C67ABE|nr:Lrp/AsnC family transcriptional regulator [Marinobacterium sedimentorum]MCP8689014.1 Lrp/AsnC family transcriptional regulator [Marinobacterium sedimentorum]